MITRREIVMSGIIIALTACRTASSGTLAAPPCAGRVVIYAYGDSAQGVSPATPDSIFLPKLPAPHGTATVRLLVTPEGRVLSDSSRVIQTNNPDWGRAALKAAVRTKFVPAKRDGFAVYFWFEMSASNP